MIKQLKQALALTALSSLASFAMATELEVPSIYEVLVVNGQESGEVFFKHDRQITLPDQGRQQVVLRFAAQRGVVNTEDMRGIAKSQPIVLAFATDGLTEIKVSKPNLYTAKAIDKYAKKPVISLTDQDGQPVAVIQDALFKQGMQINRDFANEVQSYNQADNLAAVAVAPITVTKTAAATTAVKLAPTSKVNTKSASTSNAQLQLTQQAFMQLSPAEKKAFVQWAVDKI